MKERPILFSAPMVRAVLSGAKSQTRRILKGADRLEFAGSGDEIGTGEATELHSLHGKKCESFCDWACGAVFFDGAGNVIEADNRPTRTPYGGIGDRLWVKENYRLRQDQDDKKPSDDWWKSSAWYAADPGSEPSGCGGGSGKLRPSIHMPRWASRITLEVTGVRVERLSAITEDDAIAEGVACGSQAEGMFTARANYARLWDEINGDRAPWDDDPWVWVVSFKRIAQAAKGAA